MEKVAEFQYLYWDHKLDCVDNNDVRDDGDGVHSDHWFHDYGAIVDDLGVLIDPNDRVPCVYVHHCLHSASYHRCVHECHDDDRENKVVWEWSR